MKHSEQYLGCISGTSVDGLDIALLSIESDRSISIGPASTTALPEQLRDDILRLANPTPGELDLLGHTDSSLGDFVGHAINKFIDTHNLDRGSIKAIGSHGQTVRHRPPPAQHPFTLQIGDANRIAELTSINTIADFRRRDMAAHGQGAPLVPPFHRALFANTGLAPVILNIGGISNVSILPGHDQPKLLGFDTGPGNALCDIWINKHLGKPYDEDGTWGASGALNTALLQNMLTDPYFALELPKSTGREYFHEPWLMERLAQATAQSPEDVQATLVELTARVTTDALQRFAPESSNLIVCGGGRLNRFLLERLQANFAGPVQTSEAYGIDGDAIEAAAFAWFAYRTLNGEAGNEPDVTGALGYRVLGAIYPA